MSSFGDNLRNLRKSMKLSQDSFAKKINSNQVNVSAWELGTRVPTLVTIQHIADCFGVPVSSLIDAKSSDQYDDYVHEVAQMLQHEPKIRLLFDRAKFMTPSDIDAVLGVIEAITREKNQHA